MELQFDKTVCACLRKTVNQIQTQEQTQEVRLVEGMPDIGRVLGAWGQVLVRGKQWHNGSMGLTCGVMAWVLYAPDEGGEPRTVEAWVPFQLKWDAPETERDGAICVQCYLRSVDARSISARKLMVRAGISVHGEAFEPMDIAIPVLGELPEDVQVQQNMYPVCLPKEAGEKPFVIEEILTLPGSAPKAEKIIRYELCPEITDKKVMADKVVFRGTAKLHILYRADDGSFTGWDFEIPFSQFTELEKEYGPEASVRIMPAVTNMELEFVEHGALQLKAGMTAQYLVCDSTVMQLPEDAYSPFRTVVPQLEEMEMPAILDSREEMLYADAAAEVETGRVVDVAFYPEAPHMMRDNGGVQAELSGVFQVLYYDVEGNLQSAVSRWEDTWSAPADDNVKVELCVRPVGFPQAGVGGNINLRTELLAESTSAAKQGMQVVTGLELGEMKEPDPERPSLILRRAGSESLWELAKKCGSTVEAIQKANRLTEQPGYDRMLLIPVL